VRGIATARKLPEPKVTELIDRGPFIADEAQAAGLVDHVGYRDEAIAAARSKAGSGAEFLSIARYLEGAGRPHDSGPVIALIYGTGMIGEGGGTSRLLGNEEMSAREVGRAFRQAFADKAVRAILFRIDSPGGSAVASETIWREVERARLRGKPVIVSMANVAGSGGYYIAAPADKIVAQPATLTGSIGVLAGKFVIADLLQKLGVTAEAVQRGANAAMFSQFEDFSPAGRQRLDAFLDKIYAGFKQHVAAGRHLSDEQVEAVAKGRVWTGEDAKKNGLVDELGGYEVALRLAKEAAKIPADQKYKLAVYPRQKSAAERIYDRLVNPDHDSDAAAPTAAQTLAGTLLQLLAGVETAMRGPGALQMPPLGDIR
jgi:protease IV